MKSDKDNMLQINPVKNYEIPQIPTLESARNDSVLLKKLPSRWKKNTMSVSLIGLMGAMLLSSCSSINEHIRHPYHTPTPDFSQPHHGGENAGPWYVVYLTEQEALNIIRSQLEVAGYSFDADPPDYSVNINSQILRLNLFDKDKGVAIAFDNNGRPEWDGERLVKEATDKFAQKTDLSIGVFYNPSVVESLSVEDAEDMLIAQVQEFISFLLDPKSFDNIRRHVERESLTITRRAANSEFSTYVHLADQEALGIIRALLMSHGFRFNTTPPDYTANLRGIPINLDLFDEDKGVAFANISWRDSPDSFAFESESTLARELADSFKEQTDDISFGIFYNPGKLIFSGYRVRMEDRLSREEIDERKAEARPILEEHLAAQVQEFVTHFQAEKASE